MEMLFAAKWCSYDMNQQGIPCFIHMLFFLSPAFQRQLNRPDVLFKMIDRVSPFVSN